ncbi:PC-Esterase [Dillenia turbinata]|uniref:PC-Esterase n=1 Tax=Dillenia turbinata TaxID=194707 RepID=A0AAN8YZX5_9MAGN
MLQRKSPSRKISSVSETWKFCIITGSVAFIILVFHANHDRRVVNQLGFPGSALKSVSCDQSSTPSTDKSESFGLKETRLIRLTTQQDVESSTRSIKEISKQLDSRETELHRAEKKPVETNINQNSQASAPRVESAKDIKQHTQTMKCNIFSGKWVYKPKEYPLYKATQCPFLTEKSNCLKNGRQDSKYEGWSWENDECEIPRFNGTDFLERMRDKRVIISGDSLNRQQWESLYCLLYTSLSSSYQKNAYFASGKAFRIGDYNATIEFHWNPYLVDFSENENGKMILNLDQMPKFAEEWKDGASVMLFNTGHWWLHSGKKQPWDLFQYKGKLTGKMPLKRALKLGLRTWAKWIEANVDLSKTNVFFRSISPLHYYKQWCYKITEPMTERDLYKPEFPLSLVAVVEEVITGMKVRVTYLNTTKLSQYRRDAHLAVYGRPNLNHVGNRSDCSHWCVPGLPDTWNRLLYSSIVIDSQKGVSASF